MRLSSEDWHTIKCALRIASSTYKKDAEVFVQAADALHNGDKVPMFASGKPGEEAAVRMRDQFLRQHEDVVDLLTRIEDYYG